MMDVAEMSNYEKWSLGRVIALEQRHRLSQGVSPSLQAGRRRRP